MDRKAIADRLRELASSDKNRPKAARLRDLIEDVEAALSAGVSRSSVVDELAAHGLQMTLATFDTTLKRIRKKREAASTAPVKPPDQARGKSMKHRTTEPDIPEIGSHNPTDLDQIIASKPDLEALAKLAKRKQK